MGLELFIDRLEPLLLNMALMEPIADFFLSVFRSPVTAEGMTQAGEDLQSFLSLERVLSSTGNDVRVIALQARACIC